MTVCNLVLHFSGTANSSYVIWSIIFQVLQLVFFFLWYQYIIFRSCKFSASAVL